MQIWIRKMEFFSYLGVVYFRDRVEVTTSYLEYWNAKIVNYLGQMNCSYQIDELTNCLEANEDESGNRICTKCIYNYPFKYSDEFKKDICDDKCRPYSFSKFKYTLFL